MLIDGFFSAMMGNLGLHNKSKKKGLNQLLTHIIKLIS